jgi:hypothetical protein
MNLVAKLLCSSVLVWALPSAAWAQTTLSADAVAKAKEFKTADAAYVHALCDGSKSERADALAARTRKQSELEKLMVDAAAQTPQVQKALDTAADAGDAADKAAADPTVSATDKAKAKETFQKAKADLKAAVAAQRAQLEAQVSHDYAVKFDTPDSCPDQPKVTRRRTGSPKSARRARGHSGGDQDGGYAPPAASFSVGGGGLSIGIGGGGIDIGR